MDINQAAQMIEWLDEERRRDKVFIATLEERLEQQQDVINTLQRRLNSVESDQTVMQNQFIPNTHESELLEQIRKEMRKLIESTEAKRLTAEREAERRASLERQNLSRPVQELQEKITKVERTITEISALQAEKNRLGTIVETLQQRVEDLLKKFEEPGRRLSFLEEQRRQDIRRISELESESPEFQKQIDSIRPKLVLLEELALRNERRIQDTQHAEAERRDQIQQFVDQQTLMIQERDQQVDDLINRFAEHDEVMKKNAERFETWSEAYRSMKQIIEDFQRIGDRLERRINEVAEMQRLSEERFREEWNDWQSNDQKRWKQFTLSNDEVWRSHDRDFERFVQNLNELSEDINPLKDSIDRMWKLERERAQLYRERYQTMLHEHDIAPPSTSENGNGNY